jgi:hypothetical protein
MAFEQEGVIIAITEKKTGTTKDGKGWVSQDLVVEFQDGNYAKKGVFNAYNKDIIDTLRKGDNVKVHFNLDGSEWQGRWFPKLQIWKVEVLSKATQPTYTSSVPESEQGTFTKEEMDLPFN